MCFNRQQQLIHNSIASIAKIFDFHGPSSERPRWSPGLTRPGSGTLPVRIPRLLFILWFRLVSLYIWRAVGHFNVPENRYESNQNNKQLHLHASELWQKVRPILWLQETLRPPWQTLPLRQCWLQQELWQ